MKNHLSLIVTLALLAVLPARGEGIDSLKFCLQKGDSLMQQYNTFEALKHYQRAYDLAKKRSQQQAVEHLDLPLEQLDSLPEENQDCTIHLKHTSTTKVYDVVEEMPQFPGGIGKMMEYLSVNLHYPKEAEEKGLQGRVIANFVIEPDGSITNAKILKPLDPALDAEALRLVNGMPKWTPGKQDGIPMRVKYTIPITFRLDNGPAIPALKEQPANQGPEVVAMAHRSETAKSGVQEEQPLVFVDNKEVPFEQLGKIDPKTIDHMDVLKGKSGTEKYGAKGKNGVVLITTKKGK